MGGCYLGMAGHDVFNEKVTEIIHSNEHRIVLLALDISNFKYINDFYGMDEGDKVMQDIADFYFVNEPLCLASHGIGFDQFRGAYKVDGMTHEDVVDYISRKNETFEAELSARYPLVYQHVYVGLYFMMIRPWMSEWQLTGLILLKSQLREDLIFIVAFIQKITAMNILNIWICRMNSCVHVRKTG